MKCSFCGSEINNNSSICNYCGAPVTNQNTSVSSMPMQMSADGYPMVYVAANMTDKEFNKLPQLKKVTNKILTLNILSVIDALSVIGSASQIAAQSGSDTSVLWWLFLFICIGVAVAADMIKNKALIICSAVLLGISGVLCIINGVWFAMVISVIGIVIGLKGMNNFFTIKKAYLTTNMVPDYTIKKQK